MAYLEIRSLTATQSFAGSIRKIYIYIDIYIYIYYIESREHGFWIIIASYFPEASLSDIYPHDGNEK